TIDVEQSKKLAGELRDNKLFRGAIDEYRALLDRADLDNAQRGNICYLIGRIYYEDLRDYENAAAFYVRAKQYDPNGSYTDDASRNLVACLEKLGHMVDAKRELSAAANLNAQPRPSGDVAVAKIGEESIWLSDIDRQIQTLPPDVQKELLNPEAKRNFVREYVGMELMYRAAKREGYDRDPEIIQREEQLVKNLLVQKYVVDKVMPEVRIDTADVRNFYLAGKTERYKGAPYDSVKAQVFLDYQNEKAQSAFSEYVNRLAAGEQVEFLDRNIR
ncbi:hypothetical protein C3F09_06925, partial [candidate division GN15 bacterium]